MTTQREDLWKVLEVPYEAMQHDDKLSEWMALGSASIAVFLFSSIERLSSYGQVVSITLWTVIPLLLLGAFFGLLSRYFAWRYMRLIATNRAAANATPGAF